MFHRQTFSRLWPIFTLRGFLFPKFSQNSQVSKVFPNFTTYVFSRGSSDETSTTPWLKSSSTNVGQKTVGSRLLRVALPPPVPCSSIRAARGATVRPDRPKPIWAQFPLWIFFLRARFVMVFFGKLFSPAGPFNFGPLFPLNMDSISFLTEWQSWNVT